MPAVELSRPREAAMDFAAPIGSLMAALDTLVVSTGCALGQCLESIPQSP
jgi:hypothetical protein